MRAYKALLAVDIPHTGVVEILAESNADAIEQAKTFDPVDHCLTSDSAAGVCSRVVFIEDAEGRLIAEDIRLDGVFQRYGGEKAWLLCEKAPALLEALQRLISQTDALKGKIGNLFEPEMAELNEALSDAESVVAAVRGEK